MSNKKLGTLIHGIGACQNIDSSGEVIEIEGIDTSSLDVDAVFNVEHKSDSTTQIIGKVLSYKKILKKEDCENDHQRYFWEKAECPYLYIKGILFDGYGHQGAKDAVAMLKFDQDLDKSNTRQVCGFSVEGSRLGKEGNRITKCIARKISFTNFPCQKQCIAEILEEDKPIEITAKQLLAAFKKSETIEHDLNKAEYNKDLSFKLTPKKTKDYTPITPATGEHREAKPIEPKRTFNSTNTPDKMKVGDRITYSPKKPRSGASIYKDPNTWKNETNTVRRQIVKSMEKQDMKRKLMLSEGKKEMRKDILKNMANDAFEHFEKKEELVSFVKSQYPEMSEEEVLAFAKTYAYVQMKKSEMEMVKISNSIEGNDLEKTASHKKFAQKQHLNQKRGYTKGVHGSSGRADGESMVGEYNQKSKSNSHQKEYYKLAAKDQVRQKIKELKDQPNPNLPKSETDMVKAKIDDKTDWHKKASDINANAEKVKARAERNKRRDIGVHQPINNKGGKSKLGVLTAMKRQYQKEGNFRKETYSDLEAKREHKKVNLGQKIIGEPNLPKSEKDTVVKYENMAKGGPSADEVENRGYHKGHKLTHFKGRHVKISGPHVNEDHKPDYENDEMTPMDGAKTLIDQKIADSKRK